MTHNPPTLSWHPALSRIGHYLPIAEKALDHSLSHGIEGAWQDVPDEVIKCLIEFFSTIKGITWLFNEPLHPASFWSIGELYESLSLWSTAIERATHDDGES